MNHTRKGRTMASEMEILDQLRIAFDDNDGAEFKRVIIENPGSLALIDPDGTLLWMASMMEKLPIIQAMVSLGKDINRSNDLTGGDESNPFFEPEGIIVQSIRAKDLQTVQWLLDNGATLNFLVSGEMRCLPLIAAAAAGNLEIVKLLVHRGALLDTKYQGADAIAIADENGNLEIRDYLLSLRNKIE